MTPDPIEIGALSPGFHAVRLVKGGPRAAAELRFEPPADPETGQALDRSWRWTVRINGLPRPETARNAEDQSSAGWDFIWRVAHSPKISRAEHARMVADAAWARGYAPGLPEAQPDRPVDLAGMAPLF